MDVAVEENKEKVKSKPFKDVVAKRYSMLSKDAMMERMKSVPPNT